MRVTKSLRDCVFYLIVRVLWCGMHILALPGIPFVTSTKGRFTLVKLAETEKEKVKEDFKSACVNQRTEKEKVKEKEKQEKGTRPFCFLHRLLLHSLIHTSALKVLLHRLLLRLHLLQ